MGQTRKTNRIRTGKLTLAARKTNRIRTGKLTLAARRPFRSSHGGDLGCDERHMMWDMAGDAF